MAKDLNRRGFLIASVGWSALVPGLLAGCAGLGESALPPEVSLADLRPMRPEGLEQRFEVDLKFTNPNDFDLVLSGFTFQLDVNDAKVAGGVSDQAFTLPRLGTAETTVVATSSLFELLKQMMNVMEEGKLDYRLSGLAYLTEPVARRVPYEATGRLEASGTPTDPGGLVPI